MARAGCGRRVRLEKTTPSEQSGTRSKSSAKAIELELVGSRSRVWGGQLVKVRPLTSGWLREEGLMGVIRRGDAFVSRVVDAGMKNESPLESDAVPEREASPDSW